MSKKSMSFDTGLLERVLNGSEVNGAWKDCLDGYEELDADSKIDCLKSIIEIRDHIVDIIKDINDPEECKVCLGLFYIGLKSEWMLLNTQYTYQMDANRVHHQVICQAGLLSALLGALEPYCRANDVVRIEALLAQLPNDDGLGEPSVAIEERNKALRSRLEVLEGTLAQRETKLLRLQGEWEILEASIGKKSAREIVETVRVLKDELLLLQRNGSSSIPEKYQEFEREFGGLSARQIAQHIERLETKAKILGEESLAWSEGQQLLLHELGDTDPARLVARVQELQNQVTRLTLEVSRGEQLAPPTLSRPEPNETQDLNAILGSLESALLEMTSGN